MQQLTVMPWTLVYLTIVISFAKSIIFPQLKGRGMQTLERAQSACCSSNLARDKAAPSVGAQQPTSIRSHVWTEDLGRCKRLLVEAWARVGSSPFHRNRESGSVPCSRVRLSGSGSRMYSHNKWKGWEGSPGHGALQKSRRSSPAGACTLHVARGASCRLRILAAPAGVLSQCLCSTLGLSEGVGRQRAPVMRERSLDAGGFRGTS